MANPSDRPPLAHDTRIVPLNQKTRQQDRPGIPVDAEATSDLTASGLEGLTEAREADPALGTFIRHYRLLQKLGEGGFGIVYRAQQHWPIRRAVALKIIKPGMDSREVIARFEAERQALALMNHPHIARVLDAGTTSDGRPFFVMELVEGVPLTQYCDDRRLTIRQRLELFVTVCLAVQHAHQKGIIHRDLKPSNVLVTQRDGLPDAKVIDFGIAKALSHPLVDELAVTSKTQMIGTPLYMSPEQIGVCDDDIDTRSDLYSLGVMLYQLLTGTTPFDKRLSQSDMWEVRRIIRDEEPPRPSARLTSLQDTASTIAEQRQATPRELSRHVRGDLDWIVLKAMDKDRERRYETAGALVNDIERYLRDEPVLACPPSRLYRLQKLVRRNLLLLTAASVVILALLAGTTVATWQAIVAYAEWTRANETAEIAVREQRRAERAEIGMRRQADQAESLLYAAHIKLASQHHQSGDDEQAQILLDRWIPKPEEPDRRNIEWRLLRQLLRKPGDEMMRLPGDVSCVRVSPQGSYVVAATDGGTICRYDLQARRELPSWETNLIDVRRMSFSTNGKLLAVVSYEAEVALVDTTTGAISARFPEPADPRGNAAVAFLPGQQRFVSSGFGAVLKNWSASRGASRRSWTVPCDKIVDCATSPGLSGIAVLASNLGAPDEVLFFDEPGGQVLQRLAVDFHSASLAVSHDGELVAVGGATGELEVWNRKAGQRVARLSMMEKIADVTFSADDQLIAAAERSGVVHVWRWRDAAAESEAVALPVSAGSPSRAPHEPPVHVHWQAHGRPARSVVFAPDNLQLISAGIDGRIMSWNWSGAEPLMVTSDVGRADNLAWIDGRNAVAISNTRALRVVDRRSGDVLAETAAPQHTQGWSVAADSSGKWLAWSVFPGPIFRWNADSPSPPEPLPQSESLEFSLDILSFEPHSRRLVGVDKEPELRLRSWDVASGRLLSDRPLAVNDPRQVAVSHRSRELFVVAYDAVIVFDLDTGVERRRWSFHGGDVSSVAPSSHADLLAVGRKDRCIVLLDAATGQVRQTLVGHLGAISELQFSPDGQTLLALDDRGSVKFWHVGQGAEMLTWHSPRPIDSLRLSPDGNWLALTNGQRAEILHIAPAEQLE